MHIQLTFEQARWIRFALAFATNELPEDAVEQKRMTLEILDRLGAAEQEELLAQRTYSAQEEPVNPENAAPFDGSTDYEQWRQEELEKAEEKGEWG